MAKTDRYRDDGGTLVEDEHAGLHAQSVARSRAERGPLPDHFDRFPARRSGETGDDAQIRRRSPLKRERLPAWTKTRWGKILLSCIVLSALGAAAWVVVATRSFLLHDSRFRIETSDSIQTTGNSELTRADLLSVFGSDIGRNIFFVPLAMRRAQLEKMPWVERATVMRILPDEIRVSVTERTPVAFVRIGNGVKLVDAHGVILDMPPAMMAARHYSFPVVTGIHPGDPIQQRAARMELYERFVRALDSTGQHLSARLSEVDLSDPFDLRATVPVQSNDLLLHFGNDDFLARYRVFQAHINEWEQQYPQLAGVDLRYKGEVVLKMASSPPPQSQSGAEAKPGQAPAKHKAPAKRYRRAAMRHGRRARR